MIRRIPGLGPLLGLAALLGLTACGSGSGEGVGGVSASEASALNDAAAMLDARAGETRSGEVGVNPAAVAAARADRGRRDVENRASKTAR